jgi:hypothetical protein
MLFDWLAGFVRGNGSPDGAYGRTIFGYALQGAVPAVLPASPPILRDKTKIIFAYVGQQMYRSRKYIDSPCCDHVQSI